MKNLKYFRAKAILLMFILVLVLSALSCRKPITYYMPQDLKDYCMFPVGSWWVYEDSISGEKDSIVLVEQGARIFWKENYYNAITLMGNDDDESLHVAYDLFTLSAKTFPDSYLAGNSHLYRSQILNKLGDTNKGEMELLRVKEFYPLVQIDE